VQHALDGAAATGRSAQRARNAEINGRKLTEGEIFYNGFQLHHRRTSRRPAMRLSGGLLCANPASRGVRQTLINIPL